jgi:AcrR family transcriptional regulator
MSEGSGTRAQRRKAATRQRLLRVAQLEMANRGIPATAVLDITEAADVALGTFYNHFPSKEALLDVLASQLADELSARLEDTSSTASDEPEALACFVFQVMAWFEEDNDRAAFVVEMGLRHGTLRDHFGRLLYDTVEQGISAGRFNAASPSVAAVTIGGALLSVMFARRHGIICDDSAAREVATQVLCHVGIDRVEAVPIVERAEQLCGRARR